MNISSNGKGKRGVTQREFVAELDLRWRSDRRWQGITRTYGPQDVYRLRGTLPIQYTLASHGAAQLWKLMREEPYVAVLYLRWRSDRRWQGITRTYGPQ